MRASKTEKKKCKRRFSSGSPGFVYKHFTLFRYSENANVELGRDANSNLKINLYLNVSLTPIAAEMFIQLAMTKFVQ